MAYDRLSSLEAQPTSMSRDDDPQYRDDPEFDHFAKELEDRLVEMNTNISRLSRQIALLGTKRDTEPVRKQIHNLLEETRTEIKKVAEGVKRLQAWKDVNGRQKYKQDKLSTDLENMIQEFQTVQRSALEKQRASAVAARTAIEEAHPTRENENDLLLQEQEFEEQHRMANQGQVDFQESLIIERENEIRNIEQSVGELNELFRDVAHIVTEQGGQLDMISDNIQNVAHDTRGANVELRSASRYQKNARNRACCLFVILAVILTIIVLAIVLG